MTTVNPFYTFNYSQPKEYRFSHDSVFLARRLFEYYRNIEISEFRCLDLCAGCGIIGLDFLFHCHKNQVLPPRVFDFLEIQEVYRPHFNLNQERLGSICTEINWHQQNYDHLINGGSQYHMIVANPPYFFKNKGLLSPSLFKNRCRFFLDSDFESLILAVQKSLVVGGVAFLLLREHSDQTWKPIAKVQILLIDGFALSSLDDIRGTHLVKIERQK
jgi:tRNA1(Val) A37 N6-methylase TrmN6